MILNSEVSAIVTGGSSGLGASVTQALRREGVNVAVFGRDESKGRQFADGVGCHYVRVDVGSEESIVRGFDEARRRIGQERILVNCAGVSFAARTAQRDRSTGKTRHHDLEVFQTILNINLIGTFACVARAAAGMMQLSRLSDGERGVIINTASIGATDGQIGQAAYAASKRGVVAMTLPIARDLKEEGIRVNSISPGVFDTPLLAFASDAVREGLAARALFPQRLGRADEFASMVVEICRNTYVNAADIRLDAGLRMPEKV